MARISLPVISAKGSAGSKPGLRLVDRSKPYKSCVWLEGGMAFNRRSLNACLIVHHNRGYPQLCEYNDGAADIEAILKAKERIISANQRGGHPDCQGCPHLVTRRGCAGRNRSGSSELRIHPLQYRVQLLLSADRRSGEVRRRQPSVSSSARASSIDPERDARPPIDRRLGRR